jgi:hypothetical protein
VLEIGVMSNRINRIHAADRIVRNDEVVGSIPTSSTILSITWHRRFSNHVPLRSKTQLMATGCPRRDSTMSIILATALR